MSLSWEETVRWYRGQPNNQAAILDNYFDLPARQAMERFALSEEFTEVYHLLGTGNGRTVLDFGAGNGIASYALAKSGWKVTALEPDLSDEVGAGAIKQLLDEEDLPITICQNPSLPLPFEDGSFAAIHARQVLHHVPDLEATVKELARISKQKGKVVVTREHVVDDSAQLADFLQAHPLHGLYGGETAYPLTTYLDAFRQAGLSILAVWGTYESILNYYPGTEAQRQETLKKIARNSWKGMGKLIAWSKNMRGYLIKRSVKLDRTPGRLYSFLLEKP